jgi:hypothetical protein
MTPDEIDALPEYTLDQRLKLVRYIIAQVTSREDKSYSVRGRQFTSRDLKELTDEEDRLFDLINRRDSCIPTDRALIRFVDPR